MLSESENSNGAVGNESAVRRLLYEIADELTAQRDRLGSVLEALPVSPRADVMHLGEEIADFPTEARRTIECALVDHLDPLAHALRMAADYRPEAEKPDHEDSSATRDRSAGASAPHRRREKPGESHRD